MSLMYRDVPSNAVRKVDDGSVGTLLPLSPWTAIALPLLPWAGSKALIIITIMSSRIDSKFRSPNLLRIIRKTDLV
jgi:hypothetical protein